jgi:hypothetical protein
MEKSVQLEYHSNNFRHDKNIYMIEHMKEQTGIKSHFMYQINNKKIDVLQFGNTYFEKIIRSNGESSEAIYFIDSDDNKCYIGAGGGLDPNDNISYIELLKKGMIRMIIHNSTTRQIMNRKQFHHRHDINTYRFSPIQNRNSHVMSNLARMREINFIRSMNTSDSDSSPDNNSPKFNEEMNKDHTVTNYWKDCTLLHKPKAVHFNDNVRGLSPVSVNDDMISIYDSDEDDFEKPAGMQPHFTRFTTSRSPNKYDIHRFRSSNSDEYDFV